MPKIFLIKNRLHQQQLRLAEAHKRAEDGGGISLSPPGSPLSYQDAQPLPLIVPKENGKSTAPTPTWDLGPTRTTRPPPSTPASRRGGEGRWAPFVSYPAFLTGSSRLTLTGSGAWLVS